MFRVKETDFVCEIFATCFQKECCKHTEESITYFIKSQEQKRIKKENNSKYPSENILYLLLTNEI